MASRVVPGVAETIDVSCRVSAFISVDLPALGAPASTTVKPSRSLAMPRLASSAARMRARASAMRARNSTSAKSSASSTSEKSSSASIAAIAFKMFTRIASASSSQRAAGDPHRLPPLRRGFRVDEIGETLHLGKIDLAVLECAQREFAGLGRAELVERGESGERVLHDGAAAGDVQFQHVLAGIAARRREADRDHAVDQFAGGGMPERRKHRLPVGQASRVRAAPSPRSRSPAPRCARPL